MGEWLDTGSSGRWDAYGDNAAMESLFSLLQKNLLDRKGGATKEELLLAIVTWLEKTCHCKHRQRPIGRHTPVQFKILEKATAEVA